MTLEMQEQLNGASGGFVSHVAVSDAEDLGGRGILNSEVFEVTFTPLTLLQPMR